MILTNHNFEVGDNVVVKSVKEMVAEYGDPCVIHFMEEMQYLCDKEFTVSSKHRSGQHGIYRLENSNGEMEQWVFGDCMLKESEYSAHFEYCEDELFDILVS